MSDLTEIFGPDGFKPLPPDVPHPGRDSKAAYAQLYASRGWHVMPLHHITEQKTCSCKRADCTSAGKHPRTARGVKDATTDPGIIAEWWRTWPEANIGIATGQVSGFWVLDVDPRSGGEESLGNLQDRLGGLPDTVMALTGGGGYHYLFTAETEIRGGTNKLGPGLDVKAEGGYIVVEPSNHISGSAYTWEGSCDPLEGVAIMDAPELVAELQTYTPQSLGPATSDNPMPATKIAELRSALACIPTDERDTWLQVGMALHSTQAGQQAFGLWCEWAQASEKYDASDQRRVWDSFQRDAGGLTLSTLYGFAKQRGWTESGLSISAGMPISEITPTTGFEFIPYTELSANPQPPQWLVTDFLESDTLAVLFGESGAYKSFLALDIGLNVAAGRPWHGKPTKPGPVFYICGEGHRGVSRRIAAWRRRNQVETPLPFYASRTAAELTAYSSAQAVSDACATLADDERPVLIIIDTLAANFGASDENSTKDMNLFLALVQRLLRQRFDATLLIVHHVGHMDKGRERGSYSLRGNADARMLVERIDERVVILNCQKMKDADEWKPMRATLDVVPLGIQDTEGRNVTSLAINTIESINEPERKTQLPPEATGRGKNQQAALAHLLTLQIEHEANATNSKPRVLTTDWRGMTGLPRNRFGEVLNALRDAGLVLIDGRFAELTETGRAAAESAE